jgi:hypothetical protein
VNPTSTIDLYLTDFAPGDFSDLEAVPVRISFDDLSKAATKALRYVDGITTTQQPVMRYTTLDREDNESDKITSEDEKVFREAETREEQKIEESDLDFQV